MCIYNILTGVEYFWNRTQETHSDSCLQGQGGWRDECRMGMKDSPLFLLQTSYILNLFMFSLLKKEPFELKNFNV